MSDADLQALEFHALPDAPEPAPAFSAHERFEEVTRRFNEANPQSFAELHESRQPEFNPMPEPQPATVRTVQPASAEASPPEPAFQPIESAPAHTPAAMPAPTPTATQEAFQADEPADAFDEPSGRATGGGAGSADRELLEAIKELTATLKDLRDGMRREGGGTGAPEGRKPGPQPDGSFVPGGYGQMRGGTEKPRPAGAYPRSRDQAGPSEWAHVVAASRPR